MCGGKGCINTQARGIADKTARPSCPFRFARRMWMQKRTKRAAREKQVCTLHRSGCGSAGYSGKFHAGKNFYSTEYIDLAGATVPSCGVPDHGGTAPGVPYLSPFSRVFLLNSLISLALCPFVSLAVSVSVAVFLSVYLPLFPSRINSVFPCLIHSRHPVYEHAYICAHARLSVWVFVWVCVFVISVGNVFFFSICKIVSLYFLFRHIYCTFFLLIKLMPFQSAWLVLLNKAYFQNGKNLYIN